MTSHAEHIWSIRLPCHHEGLPEVTFADVVLKLTTGGERGTNDLEASLWIHWHFPWLITPQVEIVFRVFGSDLLYFVETSRSVFRDGGPIDAALYDADSQIPLRLSMPANAEGNIELEGQFAPVRLYGNGQDMIEGLSVVYRGLRAQVTAMEEFLSSCEEFLFAYEVDTKRPYDDFLPPKKGCQDLS